MNVVQPIRDYEKLESIKRKLKSRNDRNYILYYILLMTGLYTALRISDILRIRVEDVRNDYLNIREKKTSKLRRVYLHPELMKALKDYIIDKEPYEFLFKSREGENRPITRAMAYLIFNVVANVLNEKGYRKEGKLVAGKKAEVKLGSNDVTAMLNCDIEDDDQLHPVVKKVLNKNR